MGAAGLPALLYPNPPLFFLSAALRSAPMGAAGLPALIWLSMEPTRHSVFDALLPMGVPLARIRLTREKLKARGGQKMLQWNQEKMSYILQQLSKVISGNPKNMDQCKLTSIFS
ncbi:uncharacterized protein LOC120668652 isoform X2 [Panicum virgatum]|uniref:uncharacterized protein LOC120668652 isoform X2 n=1 Tax=Panicum virgatum TaxID=38727 RepID=UPI0019D5A9F4|nr:uncharacterized protein LOC120668652 isoform X2 [Panicum virgatum]